MSAPEAAHPAEAQATSSLEALAPKLPAERIARRMNGLPPFVAIARRRPAIVIGRSRYSDPLRTVVTHRARPVDLDGLDAEVPDADAIDAVVRRARAGEIELVYLAPSDPRDSWVTRLVGRLEDSTASLYLVAAPQDCPFDLTRWSSIGDIPVLCLAENPQLGFGRAAKRCEDLILGSIFVAAMLPLFIAIAFAIKLTSPGPILFRQRRYGLNGEEIRVLKFRTLRVAEDGYNITQATRNDARITAVGALLRRSSLDELPRFSRCWQAPSRSLARAPTRSRTMNSTGA